MTPYFKTPKNKHYFFGYYDKSPVSLDNSKHLALEVDFINRLPDKNDIVRIGYFDLVKNDEIFYELTTTKLSTGNKVVCCNGLEIKVHKLFITI